MINRKNYEIWFLDFAEGNLSERQVELLKDFLDKNDDLKAEFDAVDLIKLPLDDSLIFEEKAKLKRPMSAKISLSSEDNLLIGELENDLNDQEIAQLQKRKERNPTLEKDHRIYQKTRLTPDLAVKYPNKDELKRTDRKLIPLRFILQFAAVVLLLIGLVFSLRNGDVNSKSDAPTHDIVNSQSDTSIKIVAPRVESPQELVEENDEVPKPMIEQAIVPLPKSRHMVSQKPTIVKEKTQVGVEQGKEVIVNQEPQSPKINAPKIPSPPKPKLKPQLPDSKPVIVSREPTQKSPKPVFVNEPSATKKRLIALNQPKDLLLNVLDKSVKKLTQKEGVKTRLSVPEAIVSTVETITKTKTSYEKRATNKSKKITVSFGKFKISRVKHRSR